MSIDSLIVDPVTILRSSIAVDRYGNTIRDWASPTSTATVGWVSQRTSSEVTTSRDGEVSDWVGFFLACEDIAATDRVVWSGITFEVVGPPNPARRPGESTHHFEVPLRVVEG
ncbi:MAG: hypothetical protein OEV62_00195 [Actinomycetota bacterium]|nr:hypothetical protein [Actinomycetota bacterium]